MFDPSGWDRIFVSRSRKPSPCAARNLLKKGDCMAKLCHCLRFLSFLKRRVSPNVPNLHDSSSVATSFPVLTSRNAHFCHSWELDAASWLSSFGSGFPVLDQSVRQGVRGSYSAESAKVLISESARGILSTTSMEDEVDGQEEGQDDKREDGQQREESGIVEENQTHNINAWRWLMTHDARTPNLRLEPWATQVCVNQWENVTCEVSCLHSPSVAADYCPLQTILLQQTKKY